MHSAQKKASIRDIKIILIGHVGTGKTSLMNKWIKNDFTESYRATISTEFAIRIFHYNKISYKVQLWDIGGQDRGANFTKLFCKGSHGALVISDITDPDDTLNK
jgi:small GTP-binding protein